MKEVIFKLNLIGHGKQNSGFVSEQVEKMSLEFRPESHQRTDSARNDALNSMAMKFAATKKPISLSLLCVLQDYSGSTGNHAVFGNPMFNNHFIMKSCYKSCYNWSIFYRQIKFRIHGPRPCCIRIRVVIRCLVKSVSIFAVNCSGCPYSENPFGISHFLSFADSLCGGKQLIMAVSPMCSVIGLPPCCMKTII